MPRGIACHCERTYDQDATTLTDYGLMCVGSTPLLRGMRQGHRPKVVSRAHSQADSELSSGTHLAEGLGTPTGLRGVVCVHAAVCATLLCARPHHTARENMQQISTEFLLTRTNGNDHEKQQTLP